MVLAAGNAALVTSPSRIPAVWAFVVLLQCGVAVKLCGGGVHGRPCGAGIGVGVVGGTVETVPFHETSRARAPAPHEQIQIPLSSLRLSRNDNGWGFGEAAVGFSFLAFGGRTGSRAPSKLKRMGKVSSSFLTGRVRGPFNAPHWPLRSRGGSRIRESSRSVFAAVPVRPRRRRADRMRPSSCRSLSCASRPVRVPWIRCTLSAL